MGNPYPGPRPFRADEQQIFSGRDYEVSELASLIVSHQAVLLYAQSGAGKTSVINAGVLPALTERGVHCLPIVRIGIPLPKEVPLEEITNVFAYSAIGDLLPDFGSTDAWRRKAMINEAVDQALRFVHEPELCVLVLDQFEEIFSIYPQRWQDREKFFQQVADALIAHRELRALFVLREDFLAAFDEFTGLLPERGRTRYRLERLREAEALAAIKKPLQRTARSFDANVAETLVRDLASITVASPMGQVLSVPGEFIEPVQLQVVCFTLLERLPETDNIITMESYREFGDPDTALESFYEEAIRAAVLATGFDERELREWFESQLITPIGTRGLVFHGIERTGGISNQMIELLEQRHLIRPEVRSGSRWYELTHDRFIAPIQRSNRKWKSARWSKSSDAYNEAVRRAVDRTGVPESDLRGFLDLLSNPPLGRFRKPPDGVSEDALAFLVDGGLLRQQFNEGRHEYCPLDDGIAQTIQLANQSWRATNQSQALELRTLETQAFHWAGQDSNKTLLLGRMELRMAQKTVADAQVSGLRASAELLRFLDASREALWKINLKWITWASGLFGGIMVAGLSIPDSFGFRGQLLYYGSAGLGSAFTIARQRNNSDLLSRSPLRLLLLLLIAAASGLGLTVLPSHIPSLLGVLVALVLGLFGSAILLEVVRPPEENLSP